jgi:hypothetical protein
MWPKVQYKRFEEVFGKGARFLSVYFGKVFEKVRRAAGKRSAGLPGDYFEKTTFC